MYVQRLRQIHALQQLVLRGTQDVAVVQEVMIVQAKEAPLPHAEARLLLQVAVPAAIAMTTALTAMVRILHLVSDVNVCQLCQSNGPLHDAAATSRDKLPATKMV